MAFTSLSLPLSIKTTTVDPIDKFFVPILSEAVTYDIAVGYFSSAWIRDAAEGIAKFASRGGQSRWIISPELTKEDYNAIKGEGTNLIKPAIEKLIDRSFEKLFQSLKENTRNTIAWLVRDGILRFRVAVPTTLFWPVPALAYMR